MMCLIFMCVLVFSRVVNLFIEKFVMFSCCVFRCGLMWGLVFVVLSVMCRFIVWFYISRLLVMVIGLWLLVFG